MEWQSQLITVYLEVCALWKQGLWTACQRMSPHKDFELTDQEVITIYLFGIMRHRTDIKSIYNFTRDHLGGWFPRLGRYEALAHRLNQISDAFILLSELVLARQNIKVASPTVKEAMLMDSMPIILAQEKRSQEAKVAKKEIADKGYCASKGIYYHGVKLHVVAEERAHTLPVPSYLGMTSASCHDLPAFRQVAPVISDCQLFADKAYADETTQEHLREHQNVELLTPVKLQRGQPSLDLFQRLYSSSISAIRQPVESFFNWLQQKTDIQLASKVRSYQGLVVHVFGKLAAALMLLLFNG